MAFQLPVYHSPDFTGTPFTRAPLVHFKPVKKAGTAPENYHATSIFPEYFKLAEDKWVLLKESRMDCVVVKGKADTLTVTEFRNLKRGDSVACGRGESGEDGIYIHTEPFAAPAENAQKFAFRTG